MSTHAVRITREYLTMQGREDMAACIGANKIGIPTFTAPPLFKPSGPETKCLVEALCLGHISMGHHCQVHRDGYGYWLECPECGSGIL